MNAKQRKQFKNYAIRTLTEEAEKITGDEMLAELIQAIAELSKWEKHKQLRIKLQNQYGTHLNGHWFYLVPADIYAEVALKLHMEGWGNETTNSTTD